MALIDDVVRVITTYLGLQGDAGTPLHGLWEHLTTEGPFSGLPEVPSGVKDAAWDALLSDHDAFVLFCCKKTAQVTSSDETFVDDEVQNTYTEEQENIRILTGRKKKFKRAPPSALTGYEAKGFLVLPEARSGLSRDAAESAGVQVTMARFLRQVALDVRAPDVTPGRQASLSAIAMASLERISRTRSRGILRSELPKQLGVKQTNFFYIMKQLLARNLVKATPIRFTRNRSCISTAAVHLTQFAPEISLASCQALTAPEGDSDAVRIDDEACLLQSMCAKLASIPKQTAPVFEFKQFYGLQNVQGHRLWRKMRTRLVKSGCAECYDGYLHENVLVHMVRLIKPWTPDDSSAGGGNEWPLKAPYDEVLPWHVPPLRAMLEALVGSGPSGLSSEEMMDLFHITSKAAGFLIRPFIEYYGVESHRENGLKSKRSLVYRYFATEDVRSVVQPLIAGQSQAHIPSATRIDSGAGGAGAVLSSAAAAALAPKEAQGTGAGCGKEPDAAGSGPAGADAQPSQGEAETQGAARDGEGAPPPGHGRPAPERRHGQAVEPKAKMNLNLVRQLRQDIIKERLTLTKIILRPEVRYLWHMYATEKRLPCELGEADSKTVTRLMNMMHEKKLVSDAIVVDIPAANSRLGFCQPRKVVLYTAYDCQIPMEDLQAMARSHSAIVDRRVRSRQYVDRNMKKQKPVKTVDHPVLEHVGHLIPDVRDKVTAALQTSRTYRRAMRASNPAAADASGERDSEGGDDRGGARAPGGAAPDQRADGAAPAPAGNPTPVPFDHTALDHRWSRIHMPALAQAFFNNGSDGICGADRPAPRPPRERLFSVGFVGRRSLPGKRARSPESKNRSKVKHLRLQFGTKGFSGYITAIRESGCLLIKAWRMRALHFHLVQLVGLHGGGPAPSLAVARARSIPRHLVSRAMRLTKISEAPAPAAPAATDAGASADLAPDEIVLSPMVALMSAPVCVIMQLLGTTKKVSTDVNSGAMYDERIAATLSDEQVEELLDDACITRMLTLLTSLANMGLLEHLYTPEPCGISTICPAAATGHNFTLAKRVIFESPVPARDAYRDAMLRAQEASADPTGCPEVVEAANKADAAAAEAAAEFTADAGDTDRPASVATGGGTAAGLVAAADAAMPDAAGGAGAVGGEAVPVVATGAMKQEKGVAELLKPDPRIHALESVRMSSTHNWYELTYNVSMWGGWIGFWDHCAFVRASPDLSRLCSSVKPFAKVSKDYLASARAGVGPSLLHANRALAAARASRGTKSLPIAVTRRSLSSTGLSLAEAAVMRRTALRAEKLAIRNQGRQGGQQQQPGRLGRLQTGSSRSASAAILRKKQPAPVPAADVAASPQDALGAKGKASGRKKKKEAGQAPAGQDGAVDGQVDEHGVPVKKRRAPRRPPRRQRGRISAMVNGVFVEAEIYDSDDSEGGYDVVMQRRACRRTMESLSQDLNIIRPGALTGSRRDHRGAVGATLIRLAGLSTKEAAVTESVTLRGSTARRRPPDEASGSDTDVANEEEEEEGGGSGSDQEHVPGQGKSADGHLRGRPKRWHSAEEKALLAAVVRVITVAGPDLDKGQVPWGEFAGIRHTSSACARRISLYRLVGVTPDHEPPPGKRRRKADLNKDSQFHQLCEAAVEVFRLRQRRRQEAVKAAVDRKLAMLAATMGSRGEPTGQWSLARNDEPDPMLALLPKHLRDVVPPEELRAIVTPEDFTQVGHGRLFTARDAEEERLHTELRQMLLAFFDMIPVMRPQGVSHRLRATDDADMNGDNAGVRVHAPSRRLRGELRSAARGLATMVSGIAASLGIADSADWRVAAAAAALLAVVSVNDPGSPSAGASEPSALLAAHAQVQVSRAATLLCEARVLHSCREAAVLVAPTRQALAAHNTVLDSSPPCSEIRSAEHIIVKGGGVIHITPRQRGWGGLMAVILTGATSGHLTLSLSFSAGEAAPEADLDDLDQFLDKSTFSIGVQNAPPAGTPPLHSGRLLSSRQPLCLEPHSSLFTLAAKSLHLVTSGFGVAIADTQRAEPVCLSVRGALGSASEVGASGAATDPARHTQSQARPRGVKKLLQAAVSATAFPLHTHLVAAGALPPAFLPPIISVGDTACAAFTACLDAVRAVAERAGEAGVAVGALMRSVVDPGAPQEEWFVPAESRERVLEAAVQVGAVLALRDNALANTAMLAMDQTQWPAVAQGCSASKHALACSGLQAAVSALQTQELIVLKPHLGHSLSLLSTSAHAQPDAAAPSETDTPSDSEKPWHKLSAPWILPSGSVYWPTLRGLVWQVHCTLSTYPGIPEGLLAGKLGHAVGRAHLVMLLKRMEAQGLVRCVALPMHVGCVTSGAAAQEGEAGEVRPAEGLLATAQGLVPAIFGGLERHEEPGAEALRVLPLVSHYFTEVGASLDVKMEKYGEQAWA